MHCTLRVDLCNATTHPTITKNNKNPIIIAESEGEPTFGCVAIRKIAHFLKEYVTVLSIIRFFCMQNLEMPTRNSYVCN